MTAPILVLGTRNPKKRAEIEEILGDLGIVTHDLSQFPAAPEVVEDGATFEANARKKATQTALAARTMDARRGQRPRRAGAWEVKPGIYSALCRHARRRRSEQPQNF